MQPPQPPRPAAVRRQRGGNNGPPQPPNAAVPFAGPFMPPNAQWHDPFGPIHNAAGRLIASTAWIVTWRVAPDVRPSIYHPGPPPQQRIAVGNGTITYITGQYEVGPNGGAGPNPFAVPGIPGGHWQLYLETSVRVTAPAIVQALNWNPALVWMSPRYGTQDEAIAYTRKEETRWVDPDGDIDGSVEEGRRHPPAVHEQWQRADAVLREGGGLDALVDQYGPNGEAWGLRMAMTYTNGAEKMQALFKRRQHPPPLQRPNIQIIVKYGSSRTGKSHAVHAEAAAKGQAVYQVVDNCRFDGINDPEPHKIILFEEFDSEPPITQLLKWTDKYKVPLNVKYGHDFPHWETVYFTSNHHPSTWYPNAKKQHRIALLSRINKIEEYTQKYTPAVEAMAPELLEARAALEAQVDAETQQLAAPPPSPRHPHIAAPSWINNKNSSVDVDTMELAKALLEGPKCLTEKAKKKLRERLGL